MMRAVVVKEFGGPEVLQVVQAQVPEPGTGEVLVKVKAAGVNPTDAMQRLGAYVQYGAAVAAEQIGAGVDLAGTVEAVGEGVFSVTVGDEVIGLQERLDRPLSAYADYIVVEQWAVAPAPTGATMAEAATLPLNATTADQALDTLSLGFGQWLLVTGAAGAVGGFAIELARLRGLRVVAQASKDDEGLVRGLGAELFVARDVALGPEVRRLVPGGVGGVIDAANVGVAAMDAVAHGGAYVNLLNSAPQGRRHIRAMNMAYHADGARLRKLSAFASAGKLTMRVAQTYPLQQARDAHERLASGGLRGRLILLP